MTLAILLFLLCSQVYGAAKIVIAEKGAGKDLPEDTLPATTLAATWNVDYLELHVVMTADDELLVYRELTLNKFSNIAELFPGRNRTDGNYYVIDFTLAEIRQLRLTNPSEKMQLSLIQLVAESGGQRLEQITQAEMYNHDWLFTNIGLRMVAGYAAAIGLPSSVIVDQEGKLLHSRFIEDVHKYGLKVLVSSLQNKEQLPSFAPDLKTLLKFYYTQAEIDGVYTDSFTEVLQINEQLAAEEKWKSELPAFFSSLELTRPTPSQKNGASQ